MKKLFITALIFIALPLSAAFAEVRVGAQVETGNTIYLGDRFAYHVILEGVRKPADTVDTSAIAAYNPQPAGNRDYSQSSISIINGKRTERVTKRYIMSYSLSAIKAGENILPGVNVTIDGKRHTTNPVVVNIVEPATSDKLELEMSLSKNKCYVGEPVEVTTKWFVHKTLVEAQAVNAVAFAIPALQNNQFYVEKINEYQAASNPKSFALLGVNGIEAPFKQRLVTRKGVEWIELSYAAILIPKQSGLIKIVPSILSVDLAIGRQIRRGFFGTTRETKRFMAKSKAANLNVIDLPPMDEPVAFYGLAGKYTIDAEATPTKVDVGEPITLTIKVGGSKFLTPVQWPDLGMIEDFGDFKISSQRQDPVVKNGQKIFTTTIRAGKDSVTEIPSIPLIYFDTEKGKYQTAESKPVKLDVSASKVITMDDAEVSGRVSVNSRVEAIKKGMSANFEDIILKSQDFSPLAGLFNPGIVMLWAIPFAALASSVVIKTATNTSDEKTAAVRRRQARKKAIAALNGYTVSQDKQVVVAAMREYIGARFAKQAGSLTGLDCERIICETTSQVQIAKEYRDIFESCEAAYYTGSGGDVDGEVIGRVIGLINVIEKKSK